MRQRFLVSALLPVLLHPVPRRSGCCWSRWSPAGCRSIWAQYRVDLFGHEWSLRGVSGLLLYLLGLAGEIVLLTSIYLVMPVGPAVVRHALIGGVVGRRCCGS